MRLFWMVLSLAMFVALTGCDEAGVSTNKSYSLIKQLDCETNVMCYRFVGFEGMSCVKLEGEAKSCPINGH